MQESHEAQEAAPLTVAERIRQTRQKKKQIREARIQRMHDGLAKKRQLAKESSSADADEQPVKKQKKRNVDKEPKEASETEKK